jgi:hypothetical protein
MSKFIRAADAIRQAFGDCLIPIVHHCGVSKNRPRGHTSLTGACDVQIAIERDKEGTIIAKVEHMKDGEAGAVFACKLERVDLGTDDEGDPISSCVIVPTDVGAARTKLPKTQRLAFDVLKKMITNVGAKAPPDANAPPDAKVHCGKPLT